MEIKINKIPHFHNCLIIILLQFIAFGVFAQKLQPNPKVSIDVKDENFINVLSIIEKQTRIKFFYSNEIIPKDKKITFRAKATGLDKILTALCKSSGLDYKMINGQIAIFKSDKNTGNSTYNATRYDKTGKTELIVLYDTVYTTVYDTLKLPVVDTLTLRDTVFIKKLDTLVYSFQGKKNRLLVKERMKFEVYAGNLVNVANVFFATAPEYRQVADSIKKNSTGTFSFSIGSNFIYEYKHFSVFTGLSYNIVNENIKYFDLKHKTEINHFNYIFLPLYLGYRLKIEKNTSFDLMGGLNGQFLVSEKSKLFQMQNAAFSVSDGPRKIYSIITYSWLFGGNITIKVQKNSEVFLRSMVQVPIRSLYSNEFYISRFQTFMQFSAGLTYSFK